MKKFNSIFAVVISVILIFSIVVPISAESVSASTVNVDYKIDNELKSVIENSADNDIIPVVLWLSDVDNQERSDLVSAKIKIAENRGELPSKIVTNNDLATLSEDVLTNEDLSEQADVLIELKRDVEKELHSQNNSEVLDSLATSYDIVEEPVFVSNYAPLVIVNMTKEDIENAINNPSIENIYYYEPVPVAEEEELADTSSVSEEGISVTAETSSYPYGVWQEITGINELKEDKDLDGAGIKIGLLENCVPNFDYEGITEVDSERLKIQFAYHIENNMLHCADNVYFAPGDTSHANYMLSILAGSADAYEGVAPKAVIYCDGFNCYGLQYFLAVENLVDAGVNVISASIHWGSGDGYNHISKYLDYVVSNSDVTFCISAGNSNTADAIGGLLNASSAYNVITVGNIEDNNTLEQSDDSKATNSMYDSLPNSTYKPDICAPGSRAATYLVPNASSGGTSAACPIVSGICALLMEAYPTLQTKPMLLKSLLMASANELTTVSDVYSTATSIEPALTRECGPGMVDAYTAHLVCENRDYRHYNVPMSNSYDYNIDVTQSDINANKDIYLSLNWMQWNTINGDNWDVDTNYNLLDGFQHTLSLYDPNGNLVAVSNYQYDRKQFIRYKPLQSGQYTARTTRSYTGSPAYYPAFAVASCIK